VLRDFPSPEQTPWMRFDNPREKKLGFFYESSAISDRIRRFLDAMNGFEMLLFLEALTGIDGLIPDPYFGGGGLHQIEPDGFLKVHADFNVHPKLKLDRRLNMLIYLNKEWREEYGGHLELWDAELPFYGRASRSSTRRADGAGVRGVALRQPLQPVETFDRRAEPREPRSRDGRTETARSHERPAADEALPHSNGGRVLAVGPPLHPVSREEASERDGGRGDQRVSLASCGGAKRLGIHANAGFVRAPFSVSRGAR